MFGVVPKNALGEARAGRRPQPDRRWRCVRCSCAASALMIIDAGRGRQDGREAPGDLRLRVERTSTDSLAAAAFAPRTSRSCSPRTSTSITPAASRRATRRRDRAAIPERALRDQRAASGRTRRIRTSATAPATSTEDYVPLREAGVVDFIDGDGDGDAGRPRAPHRRPHAAPSDRLPRVGRKDGGVRRRSDSDDGARRRAVDHGVRPVSDGDARVQDEPSSRKPIDREYLIFFEHDPADRRRIHPREGQAAVR